MRSKVRLLVGLQTRNLFGLNEFLHTKDKKKKARFLGMAAIWVMLTAFLVAYVGLFSYGMISIGLGSIVPEYLFHDHEPRHLVFLDVQGGKRALFQMSTYEALISLPVSKAAIVASRFFEHVSFKPAFEPVCHASRHRDVRNLGKAWRRLFCIQHLGHAVSAAFSDDPRGDFRRVHHRLKFPDAEQEPRERRALTILLVVGFIAFTSSSAGKLENVSADVLRNISGFVSARIEALYPPAVWFGKAAVSGSLTSMLLFIGTFDRAVSRDGFRGFSTFFTGICNRAQRDHREEELYHAEP